MSWRPDTFYDYRIDITEEDFWCAICIKYINICIICNAYKMNYYYYSFDFCCIHMSFRVPTGDLRLKNISMTFSFVHLCTKIKKQYIRSHTFYMEKSLRNVCISLRHGLLRIPSMSLSDPFPINPRSPNTNGIIDDFRRHII